MKIVKYVIVAETKDWPMKSYDQSLEKHLIIFYFNPSCENSLSNNELKRPNWHNSKQRCK